MQTARQALGTWGEFQVFQSLRDSGHTPRFPNERHNGDIVCQGVRIEVKTSAQSRHDSKYKFCLSKHKFTCHLHSHVVVLVCVDVLGFATFMVIPVRDIAGKKHIHMSNIRNSIYSKYIVSKKELSQCVLNVKSV